MSPWHHKFKHSTSESAQFLPQPSAFHSPAQNTYLEVTLEKKPCWHHFPPGETPRALCSQQPGSKEVKGWLVSVQAKQVARRFGMAMHRVQLSNCLFHCAGRMAGRWQRMDLGFPLSSLFYFLFFFFWKEWLHCLFVRYRNQQELVQPLRKVPSGTAVYYKT